MNLSSLKDYQKADKKLNTVYQKVLKEYKSDTAFVRYLKTAQKIWVQFRDAELKVKFPSSNPYEYGSMAPLCMNLYNTELTEERTNRLKIWLTGKDEKGCEGSVKIRNE